MFLNDKMMFILFKATIKIVCQEVYSLKRISIILFNLKLWEQFLDLSASKT